MIEQNDMTPVDLAAQVLRESPHGTKDEHGRRYLELVEFHGLPELHAFVHARTVAALGKYVSDVKAAIEKRRQRDRLMTRGVAVATGRPITPTLSVRGGDGSTQLSAWYEATPRQFIEAVLREQRVIDGRNDSNAIRLHVVAMIQDDEQLMELPTLAEVCDHLGIDPDTLSLEELDVS